jgi:Secretion system C-terminal sorting domain
MMIFNQLRSGLTVLALVAVSLQVSAQSFWTENFNNQTSATTNWLTTGSVNGGLRSWEWTNNPNAGYQDPGGAFGAFLSPTAAGGYFLFNSDSNLNFRHDVRLTNIASPINCAGKTDVRLKFFAEYAYFTTKDTSFLEVGVSTNGTSFTYYPVLANVPRITIAEGLVEVAVPAANNQPQVWIQFRWRGQFEYHLKIDDLELVNVLPPAGCNGNPNAIICENFDTYNTTTKVAAQNPTNWGVWSGVAGGGPEDGSIITTPVLSAPNALKVEATVAAGGPMDLLLKLQNKTSGNYSLKMNMFIPTGKQAYYNMQNAVPLLVAAGSPSMNMYFESGAKGEITSATNVTQRAFTFPYAKWFVVEHQIDLDNNIMSTFVDGVAVGQTPYTGNIGGVDFYGIDLTHQYFVDNIEYALLPSIVYNADNCPNAINLNPFIGLAPGVVSTSGPHDITSATVAATDPTTGFACFSDTSFLHGTHWFTFVGDGNVYTITSKASGATPLVDGDTQFALYTGSCGSFVPLACNDDIGQTNFSSTLSIPTVAGTTYFLMVDSWDGQDGSYSLDIRRNGTITCAAGKVGTNALSNNGNLCFGANISTLLSFVDTTYVIPNTLSGVTGHMWVISSTPLTTAWPGTITGIASTGANPAVIGLNLLNDGAPNSLAPGVYYLTSVVIAGGTLINPAIPARVFNINPDAGCFFIGKSNLMTLWPEMDSIKLTSTTTAATTPGYNGAINITPSGGSAGVLASPYSLAWSNGSAIEDQSGLAPGTYTVTITEPSGCVPNLTRTITVAGFVSGTQDPSVVNDLSIAPNPTASTMTVRIELAQSKDVRIDILNTLGQVVISRQLGTTNLVNQEIDMTNLASGTYFMRATLDTETAVRAVVLNK